MSHDLEFCVRCRRSVAFRFRDFGDVGLYFHWVKNHFFVDVVFFVKNCPFLLFREIWVLE